ncbi:AI-2E family transporter [Acidisoma silvae]|uniref:AI-2E family transporter n=1 Tax=Acidisoma silvae TaxID=2802396 RepID=A0A963YRV2_9PROT|nr:AI-2E family transporter [Acidisoma silvae]MCB8875270.1 AI-2E family transporter [Acidisoma silvae]
MSDVDEASALPGAGIPASETPRPQGLLILLVFVVVVTALYFAKTVLIPITLAIMLSFVLGPVVALLRRCHLPKVVAVLLAVLLALAVILLLGGIIGMQIADLAGSLPHYQATIMQKFHTVQSYFTQHLQAVMRHFGNAADTPLRRDSLATSSPGGTGSQMVEVAPDSTTPSTFALLRTVLEPVVAPIETVGIVIVFAIFFLLQKEDLRDRLIRLFGSTDLHRTTLAIDDAGNRLSRYFLAQTCINAGFGVVICIGLTFLGLPNPILWGVLAMLMRFVPYIGSLISALLPIALAAAVDPHWGLALATLILFVVAEGITGQVLEPMTYGSTTGLSPVAVLVVAVFWGWIWGPIGLILSTPLTLCLVVVGRHVKRLEFFDVLLGDRPALTPVETFYQRLLAHDPDEVQEQAEQLLQSRSLSAYYDGVARKGLELAAGDILRGAMKSVQVARLRADIATLIAELDEYDDVDPPHRLLMQEEAVAGVERPNRVIVKQPAPDVDLPPPEGAMTVAPLALCVGGRGPLDDIPSAMLAQLLGKHGFETRELTHDAVSRAQINALDTARVALICVTCLELVGQPPHLRYLLRRLRQRLPNVPIVVGLWTPEAEILSHQDLARMMGADVYVTSLRDMVIEAVARVSVTG